MPAPGVPPNTPVLELKVTPLGSVPVSVRVGVGEPEAATAKDPAKPAVNVTLFKLLMTGAVPIPVPDMLTT